MYFQAEFHRLLYKAMPVFKKGNKEDAVNYRHVNLSLISRKVTEQIILESISKHMKDKKVINSQHALSKGKTYLLSMIVFYNEMTSSVGKTSMDFVYLEFSHNILIDKLRKYTLGKL